MAEIHPLIKNRRSKRDFSGVQFCSDGETIQRFDVFQYFAEFRCALYSSVNEAIEDEGVVWARRIAERNAFGHGRLRKWSEIVMS